MDWLGGEAVARELEMRWQFDSRVQWRKQAYGPPYT